ncbi:MAG TPA: hypothetical protein VMT64_07130, partial [Candidatus Binataceae bacterium]|nr:hypothetical protein [Candidatus Binataceae bacterium]
VPGYGTQGGSAQDAAQASRGAVPGIMVNSSRGLMYAYLKHPGATPAAAASKAAEAMRLALNLALAAA